MDDTSILLLLVITCGLALILAVLAIYFHTQLRTMRKKYRLLEISHRELMQKADENHLPSIETKLNPHLFKNILNSIQSHAYQTYHAMDKMADVLDYILYESSRRWVTPKEEIAFAIDLIEINKVKISPLFDLQVKNSIDTNDPLYKTAVMAPLVTVELIENAFKHADLQSPDAFISIGIDLSQGIFELTVANKISPKSRLSKEKSGLGTVTLDDRLRIIYKDSYRIERHAENNIYTSRLTINLQKYANQMSAS
jgi:sensor histidine kinase YesM